MNVSPIFTNHPNGVKFSYLTNGSVILVNAKLNKDGKTEDHRNAFYYKVKKGVPGVLIEYPDGIKRFISNNWYNDIDI
jgi:hypothetical protein